MEDTRVPELDGTIEKFIKAKATKARAHETVAKNLESIGALMKSHDRSQYTFGTDKFILEPGHDVVKHKRAKSQ